MAWFTDVSTANLLTKKAREGVQIQVFVVDDETNLKLNIQELEALGVRWVRIPKEEGLLHFKFCIVDDHTVVYGSANWTVSAFSYNQEQITVVEEDEAFIERFREEFRQLRNRFAPEEATATEMQAHPERALLQQEISLLEAVLAETETEIVEANSLLRRFEALYQRHLGKLLRSILALRAAVAQAKADLTQKPEDQEEARQQAREYTSFASAEEKQEENSSPSLDSPEKPKNKGNLHALFREAVKLCHPDKVEDRFKEAARAVFVRLKEAFDAEDTEKVSQILEELREGIAWQVPPEQIADIEVLRKLRDKYKRQLQEKQAHLQQLLQSPSYLEITAAADWEGLIARERGQLEYEKERLQRELKELGG